ncbi:Conserved hypothetical membrane protein [Candidatus Protochlamydia naegleriophila]|uniref:Conserved hypothetical membrane protein n=1 Tax=Candidatus Protochlamydia naegleriophila TaxID=389348 RepID=A0A0U5CQE2_9BACT|nr:class I SAM-dependent methyltransferase [Candidatus Protochlamydia naegleriophila]CUI17084.1 Conserved hypothetical membrane protein [Candidatus Protochlamydia naegleriophila]
MADSRLNIVQTSPPSSSNSTPIGGSSRLSRQKENQAKFERLWLVDPEQFNPLRNWMQKERLERTWTLLNSHTELANKKVADIGCGAGVFSRLMRDAGANLEAIDIAENALKQLRKHDMHRIEAKQSGMPATTLPDHNYDVVVCTEIIAELHREDYRLFFAELARLVHPDGYVICSSPIDIHTDGGVHRLIELAQTEFDIIDSQTSYHALYIRLKHSLEAPSRYIQGWKNSTYRQEELNKRKGVSKLWYSLQTSFALVWLWILFNPLCSLLLTPFHKSRFFLLRMEALCQFLSDEKGISHYIFIAKRRPLTTVDPQERPIEKPRRKEIWD